MRPLNAFTSSTELSDDEAQDALVALNWMLDSWSTQGNTLYHITRESFNLASGVNPVTIGVGGAINTARPLKILAASINVGGIDYQMKPLGYDDFEAIRLKTLQSGWPKFYYYEPSYPYGSIWLWPVPTGNVINLMSEKPLSNFLSIYDEVILPPGYADAIKYNLSVRLAPEYQATIDDDVRRLAAVTLKSIRTSKAQTIAVDRSLTSGRLNNYNVYTDGSR